MLTKLATWQQLENLRKNFSQFSLREEFSLDSHRAQKFSAQLGPITVDFSKNLITTEVLQLLVKLANERQLSTHIEDLFSGQIVNHSEQQPALHTALRAISQDALPPAQKQLLPKVQQTLDIMESMSEKIRRSEWYGFSHKSITDVVNLGVGGSYLGPYMSTQALTAFSDSAVRLHFVANRHDAVLQRLLNKLNPETTLILVSSKSFTTNETLHNFLQIQKWFMQKTTLDLALQHHFIAITAKPELAQQAGISPKNIVPFYSWVGGRYSIWSAIGLPLCITIGMREFKNFLSGAAAIDEHFYQTPLTHNIPALLGLIDIWYINFFNAHATAILPYHQDLYLLPRYLQQLAMESIGKSITQEGQKVSYATGNVFWGGVGSTGQHAYHQLLHQGTEFIPCDFIITFEDPYLFAQCLAQTRTLMIGQMEDNPAKKCPGNRPSTTIVLPKLSPHTLGALLALYEHRIVTQGMVLQINPFDQWGVEQGKRLGQELKDVVECGQIPEHYDGSTRKLLADYYARNFSK